MRHFILGLTLLVFTAGCTTGQTLVVTGESLVGLGVQFAEVSKLITADCNAKVSLTVKQCADFKTFGEKFKQTYPAVRSLYVAATQFEDKTLAANAVSSISKLIADLAVFAAMVGVK